MKSTLLLLTSLLVFSVNAKDLTDEVAFISPQETPINILQNGQTTQPKVGGTNLAVCGSKIGGNKIWCHQDSVVNEDAKAISLSTPINTLENEQTTNPKNGGTNLAWCDPTKYVYCNEDTVVKENTKAVSLSAPISAPQPKVGEGDLAFCGKWIGFIWVLCGLNPVREEKPKLISGRTST